MEGSAGRGAAQRTTGLHGNLVGFLRPRLGSIGPGIAWDRPGWLGFACLGLGSGLDCLDCPLGIVLGFAVDGGDGRRLGRALSAGCQGVTLPLACVLACCWWWWAGRSREGRSPCFWKHATRSTLCCRWEPTEEPHDGGKTKQPARWKPWQARQDKTIQYRGRCSTLDPPSSSPVPPKQPPAAVIMADLPKLA